MHNRFYLIGFMGAGKSYWGRQMAGALQLPFMDLDALVVENYGVDIPTIFERYGESHFRVLERECLHITARLASAVVATGGGTPCFFDNMKWMKARGVTIYLPVPVPILVERLAAERAARPMLSSAADENLADVVEKKLEERKRFYEMCDIVLPEYRYGMDWLPYLLKPSK